MIGGLGLEAGDAVGMLRPEARPRLKKQSSSFKNEIFPIKIIMFTDAGRDSACLGPGELCVP